MTLIHHSMMSLQPNDTKFKIYCHYSQGESVTCNKGRGSQGEGDRYESHFPRRVGGRDVIQKGRVRREERGAPPITAKGRGWGADYSNVGARWVPYYFYLSNLV